MTKEMMDILLRVENSKKNTITVNIENSYWNALSANCRRRGYHLSRRIMTKDMKTNKITYQCVIEK